LDKFEELLIKKEKELEEQERFRKTFAESTNTLAETPEYQTFLVEQEEQRNRRRQEGIGFDGTDH
jgi:hypothetical protein